MPRGIEATGDFVRVHALECLDYGGISLCRSALAGRKLANWKFLIDSCYEKLEAARRNGDSEAMARLAGPNGRFAPTASSFTVGAAFSDEDVRELLSSLASGPTGDRIRGSLGNFAVCDLDQSWIRRQYAPSRYPPLHVPHGWHQDGALKFDFSYFPNGKFPSDAMLNMVTCWIALNSCGIEAPGLEFVSEKLPRLMSPSELRPEGIQERFASVRFCRPTLECGDALLFRGDVLHRTHVTPAMTKDRTSIELRFFPGDSLPERLQTDHSAPFC